MSIFVNATSETDQSKTYFGNYLGIVVQNNDPDKGGKVKVWIPHISPTVYKNWDDKDEAKSFKFIGRNIDSDLTDIVEDLKKILPWAEQASPITGSIAPGRYNAYEQKATISDSNRLDTAYSEEIESKYNLNSDGIGEKPARKYEVHSLKVSDAFTDKDKVKFNNLNKFAYNYVPNSYSNSAKGSFSIPNVGSYVWCFCVGGDPNQLIYFATTHGLDEWKSIHKNFDSEGLDYPGAYENKSSGADPNYNHNTETYRNKYVINQKGGTIEIVSTDNREVLKFTHYSGSFKEFNNEVNIEFATSNNQKLVQGDEFFTVKGTKNDYVGRDFDQIINGDYYKKIGNLNSDVQTQWRDLMESISDAKQLFEIKRANSITDANDFIKKTSADQVRSGTPGPCPLCKSPTTRDQIWDNSYAFTSITNHDSTNSTERSLQYSGLSSDGGTFNFSNVTSTNSDTNSKLIYPTTSSDFLGSGACPVCGGSGDSPSSYKGTWDIEDKDTLIIDNFRLKVKDLIELEKQLGLGGSEIINITKHKVENIGLIYNDFPSTRIDEVGKIDNYEVSVFNKGVATTKKESALIEYVHVDDFPGGDFTQNIGNKWNVLVGSGGVSLKSTGGVDIGGSITNIAGQQINVASEYETNISSKKVTIAAEMLTLRNKNNRQVLVDGNLGVSQNIVVGGSMHVEGELSVQHITAPVEIQETEPVVVRGKLLGGYEIGIDAHESSTVTSVDCDLVIQLYPHTHPFKNVPLKLMKDKDEVRKVGAKTTDNQGPTAAIPVVHEKKTGETGPTG